ncbi:hypothetical protein, partial [Marivita sp.]|uniref:hypothetical protein n=1 Tax=Marivita sp. TaxID=2003365 RepID=UPI003F6C1F92
LQSVPGYAQVASVMAMGGGIVLPLATSAVFATSMMIRARRWRWIDWVHLIGVLGFAGLWVTTRF